MDQRVWVICLCTVLAALYLNAAKAVALDLREASDAALLPQAGDPFLFRGGDAVYLAHTGGGAPALVTNKVGSLGVLSDSGTRFAASVKGRLRVVPGLNSELEYEVSCGASSAVVDMAWSPDGTKIGLLCRFEDGSRLRLLDVADQTVTDVGPSRVPMTRRLYWSASGDALAALERRADTMEGTSCNLPRASCEPVRFQIDGLPGESLESHGFRVPVSWSNGIAIQCLATHLAVEPGRILPDPAGGWVLAEGIEGDFFDMTLAFTRSGLDRVLFLSMESLYSVSREASPEILTYGEANAVLPVREFSPRWCTEASSSSPPIVRSGSPSGSSADETQ